jgi:hypothetical protein
MEDCKKCSPNVRARAGIQKQELGTPNPLILGPWSWLFVDNADYLRVSATANAHCLQLFAVIWMGFVTIKCPTDHGASAVSI